jgi:hypothetical protein
LLSFGVLQFGGNGNLDPSAARVIQFLKPLDTSSQNKVRLFPTIRDFNRLEDLSSSQLVGQRLGYSVVGRFSPTMVFIETNLHR